MQLGLREFFCKDRVIRRLMVFLFPGVGFQLSAEEGLPECSDALWDATPGCLHHPVAGPGPARQIRERVQVSGRPSSFQVSYPRFPDAFYSSPPQGLRLLVHASPVWTWSRRRRNLRRRRPQRRVVTATCPHTHRRHVTYTQKGTTWISLFLRSVLLLVKLRFKKYKRWHRKTKWSKRKMLKLIIWHKIYI